MSYLSPGEAFEILWHFTAEWLPSHIGHGVIWGSGAAVLLVSPDFVTDEKKDWPVLASLRRFRLVTRTRCSFVLVALFRSLLRASGGNTGSLFFGYDHRVPSLRASLQAVSEFVARNPLRRIADPYLCERCSRYLNQMLWWKQDTRNCHRRILATLSQANELLFVDWWGASSIPFALLANLQGGWEWLRCLTTDAAGFAMRWKPVFVLGQKIVCSD